MGRPAPEPALKISTRRRSSLAGRAEGSAWTLHMLRAQHRGHLGSADDDQRGIPSGRHARRPPCTVDGAAEAAGLPLYAIDLPWPARPKSTYREWPMPCAVSKPTASPTSPLAISSSRTSDAIARSACRHPPTPLFPSWKTKPTRILVDQTIDGGLRACLTCIDRRILPSGTRGPSVLPRPCSPTCPEGVDLCGENGEFHSFAWDGPMLSHPWQSRSASA